MEEKFVITEIKRIVMVGKNEYSTPMLSFGHTLNYNELIFHFSGHATVFFDDLVLETKPNTIRFLPKGEPKRYDVLHHERGECIDIFFQADRPLSPQAFVMNVAQSEKLSALFKKIFLTWVSKKEGYYFESVSLLYRIFAEMQKDTAKPSRHKLKIAPAMDMIHSDFLKRDFSLSELAAICKMGESYFQKLFKEIYGVSPLKYINGLKISHAKELIMSDMYPMHEISKLSGYSKYSKVYVPAYFSSQQARLPRISKRSQGYSLFPEY